MAISFVLEGKFHTTPELLSINDYEHNEWLSEVQEFIKNWTAGNTYFEQKTSGSTGSPQTISISRKQMEASAKATIAALAIPNKANVLHCINPAYIGGKMMLVRAFLGEWTVELIPPSTSFLAECTLKHYHFAAFVPMQISALATSKMGLSFLNRIDQAIIGGAAVDNNLAYLLQQTACTCYSTYGMTETVSHIGLKQINREGASDFFKLIGDNEIRKDERDCLKVKGSVTEGRWIQTNDVIELVKGGFIWLGRTDFVVNSGGVKIQIEATEAKLNALLNIKGEDQLLLWKAPDSTLGEILVAIVSSNELMSQVMDMEKVLKEQLPKYHFPRKWYINKTIYKTASGKLDRKRTYESVNAE